MHSLSLGHRSDNWQPVCHDGKKVLQFFKSLALQMVSLAANLFDTTDETLMQATHGPLAQAIDRIVVNNP